MLSHCYRFIFRPPTKHFVRHMNKLGILSHVWNVFSFPYNKARRWTNKIGTSSHVWNLRLLDHTQQYIQHMDQVGMLIHSFGFTCPVPYEVWTSMASWLMSKCALPSPTTRQYVEHMERKASWVIFEIYSPSALQSNTLKKTVKLDTSSYFFKFSLPRPYKANGWTRAENWHVGHVGVFLKFITSRRLWHVESSFWSLNVLPPSPPIAFKTLRSTYRPIWNLESLLCFFPAVPYKNTTFNI